MLTGSVDPKKFLIDLRYHLLSTWTTAVCMHLLGYIMVILFRPEGNKFIAGDSNQLFYLLGISGITSMILSLVSVKKNGTITKKKLYANAQVLLLGGLTWYLIGVIDLPLIKDQIDSCYRYVLECFMSSAGEDIEASRGWFCGQHATFFFLSNQPKMVGLVCSLSMYRKKALKLRLIVVQVLACCERRFSAERVVKDDKELNYYSSESVKISTGSAREGVESQAGLARKMLLAQVSLGKCCLRRS